MIDRWETTTQYLDHMQQHQETGVWQIFSNHFFPVICSMAQQKGLKQSDAEDVAQQVLFTFVQSMRTGKYDRTKGRLSSFLFGIAQRTILNHQKKTCSRQLKHNALLHEQPQEYDSQLTWETQWQKLLLIQGLERIKHTFEPKVFQAFELYCLQEKPVQEVADTLNITPNAVYIAKSRVLNRLRSFQTLLQDWEAES